MSLVNDVLRDLEKRGERTPPERSNDVPVDRSTGGHFALFGTAVGALLLAVPLLWIAFNTPLAPGGKTQTAPAATPATALSSTAGVRPLSVPKRSIEPAVAGQAPGPNPDSGSTKTDAGPATPEDEREPVRSIAKVETTFRKVHPTVAAIPSRPITANTEAASAEASREHRQDGSTSPANDGKASISIRRAGSDAHQTLMDARQSIRRGETRQAKKHLKALLAQHPRNGEARLLLSRLLRDSGRPQAAKEVLATGLDQGEPNPDLALALARLHLDRDRHSDALEVLERHRPALQDAREYHLTLAATYRLAQRHEAAARVYRDIVRHYPDSGTGWTGLALSRESLGQSESAVQAYRNALANASRPRMLRFAQQRLSALTQTSPRQRVQP